MLFWGGTKRNEKQTLSSWVQKGNPGAEVTIFADLSLRFAPDNWGLFSAVNLCQFESNYRSDCPLFEGWTTRSPRYFFANAVVQNSRLWWIMDHRELFD